MNGGGPSADPAERARVRPRLRADIPELHLYGVRACTRTEYPLRFVEVGPGSRRAVHAALDRSGLRPGEHAPASCRRPQQLWRSRGHRRRTAIRGGRADRQPDSKAGDALMAMLSELHAEGPPSPGTPIGLHALAERHTYCSMGESGPAVLLWRPRVVRGSRVRGLPVLASLAATTRGNGLLDRHPRGDDWVPNPRTPEPRTRGPRAQRPSVSRSRRAAPGCSRALR